MGSKISFFCRTGRLRVYSRGLDPKAEWNLLMESPERVDCAMGCLLLDIDRDFDRALSDIKSPVRLRDRDGDQKDRQRILRPESLVRYRIPCDRLECRECVCSEERRCQRRDSKSGCAASGIVVEWHQRCGGGGSRSRRGSRFDLWNGQWLGVVEEY